mgnify:CR=1 FL=1
MSLRTSIGTGLLTGVVAVTGLISQLASAEENLWVYAKGVDTRPEGSFEAKLSDTIHVGKNSGSYTFHDIRPEIEYGVTDSLTVGIEAIIFDHNYSVDDADLNPMFDTQGGAGQTYNKTQYAGYEISMKYNVLSPYKDPIGLSLGLGYENRDHYRLDGADIDQDSFVGTVFLQKDYLDDTLIFVLNTKFEFERRKSPGVLEEEIAVDIAAGVSYRIAPQWFVGMEFRHQSDYLNPQEDGEFDPTLDRSSFDLTDFRLGSQHQRGNYMGPTVHYADKTWWATAGILWQVAGGGSPHSFSTDDRNWDEHEKRKIGLSFGYEF